jgi:hypothetical protein
LQTAGGKERIGADEHRADSMMRNVSEGPVNIAAVPGWEYLDVQP